MISKGRRYTILDMTTYGLHKEGYHYGIVPMPYFLEPRLNKVMDFSEAIPITDRSTQLFHILDMAMNQILLRKPSIKRMKVVLNTLPEGFMVIVDNHLIEREIEPLYCLDLELSNSVLPEDILSLGGDSRFAIKRPYQDLFEA